MTIIFTNYQPLTINNQLLTSRGLILSSSPYDFFVSISEFINNYSFFPSKIDECEAIAPYHINSYFSIQRFFFALTQSLTETQIQSRLELYQTNLILNASEWQPSSDNQKSFTQNLLGNNPYLIAQEQYNNILTEAESVKGSEKISNQEDKAIASETPRKQLKQEIQENQAFIEDLKIKLGIIYAYQENNDKAIAYWQEINDKSTAEILNSIWINNSDISVNKQEIIEKKIKWMV